MAALLQGAQVGRSPAWVAEAVRVEPCAGECPARAGVPGGGGGLGIRECVKARGSRPPLGAE